MVKKLAIGCAGVLLVVMAAGAIGMYYVYQKAKTTFTAFAEFSTIPELERQVRNRAAFSPPATGELTAEQVERLVAVQDRVRAQIGQRFSEIEQKYRALGEKRDATVLDVPQLLGAYRDLASAYMDAKRAQVEALNEARFSVEEYRWVRQQAYAAIGGVIMDYDVSRLIEDIQSGDPSPSHQPTLSGSVEPKGPEQNLALVERYKKKLEENIPLSFFGL
jgi:hypothetical protein